MESLADSRESWPVRMLYMNGRVAVTVAYHLPAAAIVGKGRVDGRLQVIAVVMVCTKCQSTSPGSRSASSHSLAVP